MIRLFTILYKLDLNRIPSALSLYRELDKHFHIHHDPCPECRATGHLTFFDTYERHLVAWEDGSVQDDLVHVRRVTCASCGATSAILPDVIVPHKSYSLIFILHVLKAYFFRDGTVAAICERFGIALATLYAWKKRYLTHQSISLGKLEKYLFEQDPLLAVPEAGCFTTFIHSFYLRFGFSFLQFAPATECASP